MSDAEIQKLVNAAKAMRDMHAPDCEGRPMTRHWSIEKRMSAWSFLDGALKPFLDSSRACAPEVKE